MDRKFLFIGDGDNVLKHMGGVGVNLVAALVPEHLLELTTSLEIPRVDKISNPEGAQSFIQNSDFDVLICCGFPYRLPDDLLKHRDRTFLNVHPSCLPALAGPFPVCGAILQGEGAGATLHVMSSEIDKGPIIARESLEVTEEMDLGILHHMVCHAQLRVFDRGLERDFAPDYTIDVDIEKASYFKIEEGALEIDFSLPVNEIVKQVRAFSTRSIGARFRFKSSWFFVFTADYFENDYMSKMHEKLPNGEVVCIYDGKIVIKFSKGFLRLGEVQTQDGNLQVGDRLLS